MLIPNFAFPFGDDVFPLGNLIFKKTQNLDSIFGKLNNPEFCRGDTTFWPTVEIENFAFG